MARGISLDLIQFFRCFSGLFIIHLASKLEFYCKSDDIIILNISEAPTGIHLSELFLLVLFKYLREKG